MLIFFVHCLTDNLGVHLEGCLIALLDDCRFHFQCFLEIDLRWASLGQNALGMACIDLIDVWGNIFEDLLNISVFANIINLDVPDSHTRVQGIIDHGSSCHINVGHLDGFLVGVANAWFL